jgi:hypothetical protein
MEGLGLYNSPKNLVEISKMRKLDEARRNWNINRKMGSFHYSPSQGSSLPSIHGSDQGFSDMMRTFGKRLNNQLSDGGVLSQGSSTFKKHSG